MKVFPFKRNQRETSSSEETKNFLSVSQNILVQSFNYLDVWKRVRVKLRVIFIFNTLIKHQSIVQRRSTYLSQATIKHLDSDKNPKHVTNEKIPKGILHPNSTFKNIWGIYMGILIVYTAIIMPYVLAFIESNKKDEWFYIDLLLDSSFFFDFIVNIFSAYYKSDGSLVTSRKEIIINYAKSWMIFDLVSCIPFSLFEQSSDQDYQSDYKSILKLLRLPKLYRVFRIFKVFKMVSGTQPGPCSERFQDFLSLKQSGIRLLSSCFTIIIALHIAGCFWFYLAKIQGFSPDTWVAQAHLIDTDQATQYISSLYWAATTFATVGYGDISANTTLERIFCIFWMIFSVYYFSFVIGSLASMMESVNVKSNFLTNKLAIMDVFAKDAKLSKSLLKKIRLALKYASNKNLFQTNERNSILTELPLPLKYELSMAMYGNACSKIDYFKHKDKVIITGILPFLHPLCVDHQEYVYSKGEHAEGIYFITKGHAGYIMKKSKTIVKKINCGEYFGDIEIILHITRKYSVKAIRSLEVLFMDTSVIQNFSKQYLDEWEKIRQDAIEKHYEIMRNICEIKETISLGSNFDMRKFIINVEGRVLKKKNETMKQVKFANRAQVNIQTIHKKMENMSTRLYNLENSIKTARKRFSVFNRRKSSMALMPYRLSFECASEEQNSALI